MGAIRKLTSMTPSPDWRHESEHRTVLVDHPVPRNDNVNMAQLEPEDKGI